MVQQGTKDELRFQPQSTPERDLDNESYTEPIAALVIPPDGGWGWVVVAASFMCNVVVDGILLTGGAFNSSIKEEFEVTERQVAMVNSMLVGFCLIGGPFVSALANKYGFRVVTISGSLISSAALAISYYATSIDFLYVVYSIIGGIGLCMIYMSAVLIVGFYFEKWRALATGLALCGSGVGVFIMSPVANMLIAEYGWRMTIFSQGGMLLLCIVFGSTFRPIKPVSIALADEEEDDVRNKEAVAKLSTIFKAHKQLDTEISPTPESEHPDARRHTWMGAESTPYPTAEELFRRSSMQISERRRSSAKPGIIKKSTETNTTDASASKSNEQKNDKSNVENADPLIKSVVRILSETNYGNQRRATIDAGTRPMYRDDIFFGGSVVRLPQYRSRTSIGYHMTVTRVPDPAEGPSGICRCCPKAIRRSLATMLDVTLFKSPTFLILMCSGFFTMLGFFVPFMYVKQRADFNGMPSQSTKWLVSSIGVANILGRVVCGLVSSIPKISPLWVNNIALTAGGIATMLSGLCYETYFQFCYCVIFGLACACFASLRSVIVVNYLGLEKLTNCFGLFLLFQGIGGLLSTPIAGTLFDSTQDYELSFYVSGAFILLSSLMCYPINRISKWEKTRKIKKILKISTPR